MFSVRVKVSKEDFAGKQQMSRDRAPLKHSKQLMTINEWFTVLNIVYFMFMSAIFFS